MRLAALLAASLAGCSHVPAAPARASFVDHVSGQGRPVIFIPDLGAPADVWQGTVEHLSGRVEAHVLDVAGFAGNAPVAGPLLPRLKTELAAYVKERRLDRPVVVGHLFGAAVAYWLAMTEPDLLGGVIAIDAPPSRSTGDAEEAAEARAGAKALAEAAPERFAQMLARRLATSMADPARAAEIGRKLTRSDQAVISEAFLDMMTRDLREATPSIRVPVLVVLTTGNLPADAAPEVERAFREQLAPLASQEVVVVPGSRHYVMFDAPQAFFENLDRFLAKTAR
ncbi:MAG TPA: alpha/beta hydrolase [Myxococcales bacterium]|jgi:pimeloyl-ACP methyl ester carboxylesterase